MTKGRITLEKRKAKKQQKRRYRYDDDSPVVELFTIAVRNMAIEWIEKDVMPLLEDYSAHFSADEIHFFEFKEGTLRTFKRSLARFFKSIGGKKGTKYGDNMIIRYFCDPRHSTILCKENSLKSSIRREILSISLTNFKCNNKCETICQNDT